MTDDDEPKIGVDRIYFYYKVPTGTMTTKKKVGLKWKLLDILSKKFFR